MPIRRALISVYDKTGVVEFARALHSEFDIEIVSTGGTAKLLKENGIPVTLVEDITGFPEMLDGRVKTLHPKIFAGILADRDNPEHMRQLEAMGVKPIDMVVVNLYPFEKTVADPNCTFEQAIEMIDIGGVALLRAAAKNHKHVLVVSDSGQFTQVREALRGEITDSAWEVHAWFATRSFTTTQLYDLSIRHYLLLRSFASIADTAEHFRRFPSPLFLGLEKRSPSRYGENPHQQGAVYRNDDVRRFLRTKGNRTKQEGISYNNYLDADAALRMCMDLHRERANLLCSYLATAQKCGTGLQPVECSTGFQPVHESGLAPVANEKHNKRNLPHIETPGKVYFVTFRLKDPGNLAPDEREIVFNACLHWRHVKMDLHAAVVMPDHVHLLMTPCEKTPGQWVSLGEILHSIKRFSSAEIDKLRGRSGPLWLDESFDRIMRNEKEFLETWEYIRTNPVKKQLAPEGMYRWYWDETMPAAGGMAHRLETCATPHRLQTGATVHKSEPCAADHRLETGATLVPSSGAATCVFVKHNNPCGTGVAADPVEAYRRAYLGDFNAAMGGILAVNLTVTADFAAVVMDTMARWGKDIGAGGFFLEVWVAPQFTDDAVKLIRGTAEPTAAIPHPPKKPWGEKVRLLVVGDMNVEPDPNALEYRSITGGMLVQSPDVVGLNEDQWKVVTKRSPTESEMSNLRLAWLIAKHTKSNAISLVKDGMLIGNGAGQMSRVMSCRIAVWLARENGHLEQRHDQEPSRDREEANFKKPDRALGRAVTHPHQGEELPQASPQPAPHESLPDGRGSDASARSGAHGLPEPLPDGRGSVASARTEVRISPVAASDAFFPFRDGPDILMDAGVTAIIQPGGSKRDAEVIAACDERGVAMIFTGTRHFRH
ncbi:MAG: hypothetical protein IT449_00565 [Phycisphaerales bacterium]|nr:hypothetical protein [Phycisphaerales bacterium]